MKRAISMILAAGMTATTLAACGSPSSADTSQTADGELKGEITFWHSFTQGARMEAVQSAADKFMQQHPDVKINIETYSWGDFNTKWNAGLTTGDLPDMSTAQNTGEVVEMLNAEVLEPVDDMIESIGRDRFSANALSDMSVDGATYGVPYYSHAQVMWYREDMLKAANLEVPTTWDEFYDAAVALTKDGTFGAAFSCSPNDLLCTRYLNYYVQSAGGSLLNDDLTANLTSPEVIDGIN